MEKKTIYYKPLGNPERSYRQDRFLISTFNGKTGDIRRGFQYAKELGFDMLEFGWVSPEDSEVCMKLGEEVGIDGIYQNWNYLGGFQTSEGGRKTDYPALEAYVREHLRYHHLAGYYVWDEPLEEEQMRLAGEQTDFLEKIEPGKLHFSVALPSYNRVYTWKESAYPAYLERFASIVRPPVLSMDHYPFHFSQKGLMGEGQLDDSLFFADLAALRKTAEKHHMPMWFYFQTQDDPNTYHYFDFSAEKMRMQANLALLYGAKALQYYNIFEGVLNENGTQGPLFWQAMEYNRAAHRLGFTLIALRSTGVYHGAEVLRNVAEYAPYRDPVENSRTLAEEPPFRCSVGEFLDPEENPFLMVLNRDFNERRSFTLKLKGEYRVWRVSPFTGEQEILADRASELALRLSAGDAALLRLQPAEEEPFLTEYHLEK